MALRGLEEHQEQKSAHLVRDTRTIGQRVAAFFKNPNSVAALLVVMSFSAIYVKALADVIGILIIIFFFVVYFHRARLPFRMPMHSGLLDYNDLKPGSGKPNRASGIYFFGNENNTNQELWFSDTDMRTHVLIFGSTGSGKTEALISLAYSALVQGSGFIYVDGKGDNALYAKIFSMVRYMGREDDMLLINFMTGAKDIIGPQEKRLSNTMNPFSHGSSSMLSQLVVSMMDASSASGDGDMWKGRAIAFVESLMKVLVAVRDAGYILLDANTIRNYFSLERVRAIAEDKVFAREGEGSISLEFLPDVVLQPIKNYLITLPGYNKQKKNEQVSQVFEQHGFITMQLTRVFTSLADTYGHILRTKLAEVDLRDVVMNRRILVTLLPALEKSPDELANLGKVVVASLKAMMAAGLGESVEGEFHDLIQRKPTNASTPFLCILDEYGYYAVKGFAVVPAQARSLGFSVVFAGQDLPAFQKVSKEEAMSIGANTNIKICMKLEDPQETWEFFMKTAGESYVTHVSGFQSKSGSVTNAYLDTQGASVERRQRIDLLDLKDQIQGDMHIFFRSKIIRARSFYADPKPVKRLQLNQFLKVDLIKDEDLYVLVKGIEDYEALAKANDTNITLPAGRDDDAMEKLVDLFAEAQGDRSIDKAMHVLRNYKGISQEGEGRFIEAEVEVAQDSLNLFKQVSIPNELETLLLVDDTSQYSQPLLTQGETWHQLSLLERLCGSSEGHAKAIAEELISDLGKVTDYPPKAFEKPDTEKLVGVVEELAKHVTLTKEEERKQKKKGKKKDDKR